MAQISNLPIGSADVTKLESAGFLTAEDIILVQGTISGFTDKKSAAIKKVAMHALVLEATIKIDIKPQSVICHLRELNGAIETAVRGLFDVNEGRCTIAQQPGKIIISKRLDSAYQFSKVLEQAKNICSELSRRSKTTTKANGQDFSDEEIIEFASSRGFDGFYEEVFDEIAGNELMKRAISAAIFSSFNEPVHVIIIGDPGSAKTLARDIIRKNFSGVSAVGANTTRAGLVCNMASGQLGALAYSDNRLVLLDEFDKIQGDNIDLTYELLSNGTCSIHSGKIHREIQSRFTAIALGNPKTGVFGQYPLKDIGMDPVLMSRFALIVRSETVTGPEREELFRSMIYKIPKQIKDIQQFDQWVTKARNFNPEFEISKQVEDRYIQFCSRLVDEHIATELRRDLRMGMYMRRIPMAIARASFQNVNDEILNKAFKLIKEAASQWAS